MAPRLMMTLCAAAWMSCSGSGKVAEIHPQISTDTSKVSAVTVPQRNIDPMSFYRPMAEFPEIKFARDLPDQIVGDLSNGHGENVKRNGPLLGYRVQLYATRDYYEAVSKRDEAIEKFDDAIHMDFDAPYYKIRLGDFAERQDAETARHTARDQGYADAWVVRTPIATIESKEKE